MVTNARTSRSRTRSRGLLIGLMLVFAAPLALASLWYALRDYLPVPGGEPHGQLLQPVRPLERLPLTTANGQALGLDFLEGKWTLVYVGDGECDLYCEASLFKMRQVRRALGRDMARVQRLYVASETNARAPDLLAERYPRMPVAMSRTHAVFGQPPSGTFFLIDPLANVMMRYGRETTSDGLKGDLERLLDASQVG